MEGTFGRHITSPLFTFKIGPEKKEFTVHSGVLAQLSVVLDKLMNGDMLEAKTRRVDWSDVDEDTFVRLCEYAYLQEYTPPLPSKKSVCFESPCVGSAEQADIPGEQPQAPEPENAPPASLSASDLPSISMKEKKRRVVKEKRVSLNTRKPASPVNEDPLPYKEKSIWTHHLKDSFSPLVLEITSKSSNQARAARFSPQANTQDQDFTPVFIGHARLYILANKYMITPLCQLALSKVAQTLHDFTLYRQSLPAVIEFVRFIYADSTSHVFVTEPLRKLVTSYMVSSLGQLGDDKNFQALLEEGGDFVADFWRAVWKDA